MPTYEYRCPEGHEFERFAKMSEASSSLPCPTCGKTAERQLSGGAGLLFKGSGFYLTDYGKNAHRTSGTDKAGAGGDKASGGESSKPNESKGGEGKAPETKPASGGSGSDKSSGSGGSDKSSGSKKSDH